jgi:predicted nucleic acid-binding protein
MAAFVDTNILVYAFANAQGDSPEKVLAARALLTFLFRRDELILSAQVLNEFVNTVLLKTKPPLQLEQVQERVLELSTQTVVPIDASLVRLTLRRTEISRISYWDALIVEAAIRSGADVLYTEDMHHGTRYDGLELVNPFVS